MPKFLEERLKQQARKKGFTGKRADKYVYGAMNDMGAMHGSKETAKGAAMEKKHEEDSMKKPSGHMREMRVEIHRGPKKEVTGFTVHHHMLSRPASKSGAFMENESHTQPFSAKEHGAMMKHVADHLSGVMKGGGMEEGGGEDLGEGGEE